MSSTYDMAFKVLGLVVLVAVILFILTWSGVVKCKDVSPYWCDAYDLVAGSPRVLIVFSDTGLGDPQKLRVLLQDPKFVGAGAVDIQHIDRVTLGNLKKYKLVIVDHARRLTADQLYMFMEYVTKNGGRLVWVGDAGVEYDAAELRAYYDSICQRNALGIKEPVQTGFGSAPVNPKDINCNDKELKAPDNPWFRVKETDTEYQLINFDEFLGLKYVGNYCLLLGNGCSPELFVAGSIQPEATGNHPLIYGLSPTLDLKVRAGRDFSIVRPISDSASSNIVLSMNNGGMIYSIDGNIPRILPIIVTSSTGLGERVAYYAYPPEYFVEDNQFGSLLKNMYFGMLGR